MGKTFFNSTVLLGAASAFVLFFGLGAPIVNAIPDCAGSEQLGTYGSQICWNKVRVDKYKCFPNADGSCSSKPKENIDKAYCSSCSFGGATCSNNDDGVCSESSSCNTTPAHNTIRVRGNCAQCIVAGDPAQCRNFFDNCDPNLGECAQGFYCQTGYYCNCNRTYPDCWEGGGPPPPPPPGCGTCSCTPACESSCSGICSDNGAACTVTGGSCSGPIATPTPSCSGFNYFDVPADGSVLVAGSTNLLRGWGRVCVGPAGQGVREGVNIYRCDQGTKNNCVDVAGAIPSENRPDTAAYCGSGDPNSNGWYYDWAVPTGLTGSYTLWSAYFNDPGMSCYIWSEKNITVAAPTVIPTPQPTPYYEGRVVSGSGAAVTVPRMCRLYELDLRFMGWGMQDWVADCQNNVSTYSNSSFESASYYLRSGIYANIGVVNVLQGITPAPNVGLAPSGGYYPGWGWGDGWSTGKREIVFVVATPTPAALAVSGVVYDDPYQTGGGLGKCTGDTSSPIKPAGSSQVRVNPDAQIGIVQGNGSYSVASVAEAGLKTIALENIGAYQCTCPTPNCQYTNADVSGGNNTGWNFFVSNIRPVWWKAIGGPVHAQSGASVAVPASQYLIGDLAGIANHGVASKNAGNNFTMTGGGALSTDPTWDYTDALANLTWKYGYAQMYARAGRPTTALPTIDAAFRSATGVYFVNGDLTISESFWSNMSGKKTIFVNGSVTISSSVTLQNPTSTSDFFALIVSGNITIDPSVGNTPSRLNPTSADASLMGAFLADGNVSGGTGGLQTDRQLVFYGSVAADAELNGAGNIVTQRDLGVGNAMPAVVFIWNPSMLLSAPDEMKDTLIDWKGEVAP